MPLSLGDRLVPYEILLPIGAGGMWSLERAQHQRVVEWAVGRALVQSSDAALLTPSLCPFRGGNLAAPATPNDPCYNLGTQPRLVLRLLTLAARGGVLGARGQRRDARLTQGESRARRQPPCTGSRRRHNRARAPRLVLRLPRAFVRRPRLSPAAMTFRRAGPTLRCAFDPARRGVCATDSLGAVRGARRERGGAGCRSGRWPSGKLGEGF